MKFYKISEVAKLFDITRKTLIYYDKIDLFKPSYVDRRTSYRFYEEEQFFKLRFILTLKDAGFLLSEIQDYTRSTTPKESLECIRQKSKEVEAKIKHLKKTQEILKQKEVFLEELSKKEYPKIINLNKRRCWSIKFEQGSDFITHDKTFHSMIQSSKELGFKEENTSFLTEVDISSFGIEDYSTIDSITKFGFLLPNDFRELPKENEIPSGTFATIKYRGPWASIDKTYKELIDFIGDNGYKANGKAIEIFSRFNVHLGRGRGKVIEIFIPVTRLPNF